MEMENLWDFHQLTDSQNLLIGFTMVIIIVIATIRLLPLLGITLDTVAIVMMLLITSERVKLVSNHGNIKEFIDYSLLSWLLTILVEGRTIWYIKNVLQNTRRLQLCSMVMSFSYYITANTAVLLLQYCTYIHSHIKDSTDNIPVILLFGTTASVEMLRIIVQGPLLCKTMSVGGLQFHWHKTHLRPVLGRIAVSNFVMGLNSYLLLTGVSPLKDSDLGSLIENVHLLVMTNDVILRFLSGIMFSWQCLPFAFQERCIKYLFAIVDPAKFRLRQYIRVDINNEDHHEADNGNHVAEQVENNNLNNIIDDHEPVNEDHEGDPVEIRNIINNNFDYFNDAHVLVADNLEPEDHENNNVVPNTSNDIITISSECTDTYCEYAMEYSYYIIVVPNVFRPRETVITTMNQPAISQSKLLTSSDICHVRFVRNVIVCGRLTSSVSESHAPLVHGRL